MATINPGVLREEQTLGWGSVLSLSQYVGCGNPASVWGWGCSTDEGKDTTALCMLICVGYV